MFQMNTLKIKNARERLNTTIEDTSRQAIVSAIATSIYVLDHMNATTEQIQTFYDNICSVYAMPGDIFGKEASDLDVLKIISEKFPGVDFSKLYPIIKIKIQ